jgi:aminoglycoside phosphotransferase (APT) family kinase protein
VTPAPDPDNAITEAMVAWVKHTVPGLGGDLAFRRIGSGRSNLTYLVEADGAEAVLRRPPLGELLPSAHDMAREHRILSALQDSAVAVAEILGFCDDPAISEHPFYVMSRVDGHTIDSDDAAGALDVPARAAVGQNLATTLATLHHVDIDEVGLGSLGRREGYAERQIRRWARQWELTRIEPIPEVDDLAAALAQMVPREPARPALVHGDYNLSNVIVSSAGEVNAVLDWELCTVGHPLADLGTLLTYWPDSTDQATLERDPVPLLEGFGRRADLIEAYAAARPDDRLEEELPFWTALAAWKLAIILQGVYRRWLENPANGGRDAGGTRTAVEHLATLAAAEFSR